MSEQDLISKARAFVEAFNANDWARYDELMAKNGVYNEVGTGHQLRGTGEIVTALKGWKQAMPDAKGTVTSAVASGNRATLEVTWKGTQTGPFASEAGTIPPSGKSQTTPSAFLFDFDGDKIAEGRHYFDMLSLLQQIGAMPA
ncbi:MAG: ester cyclase [Dehalococcoidia bacterium]|nr:ester cyclase [Dehalococcoidia bacterium]